MMRFAVFSLFLFFATIAQGQSLTVEAVDAKGRGLIGVEVFLEPDGLLRETNAKGRVTFTDLESIQVKLILFKPGYAGMTEVARTDVDTVYRFEMTPLSQQLETVVVRQAEERHFGMRAMNGIEGTAIYAGKKTEVLMPEKMEANKAANTARQVYARIPGVNVWESDGAGIQLGIGVRGLSPNRTANINVRQNGYDISADALGYPESYYTPPMEAIDRIEFVRGAASLQFGTQFGGMMNFVMKRGPEDDPLEVVTRQTVGNHGFFSSFNSVGGSTDRLRYYGFYQYKTGNGQRPNSQFDVHTAYASASWKIRPDWTLHADLTHMDYLAQQPGGLTDEQFAEDPDQSTRERNWFDVDWNLASLRVEGKLSNKTQVDLRLFGLLAQRQSLGFLSRPDRIDDPTLPRDLIRGEFANLGGEARLLHRYHIGDKRSAILIGGRFYRGNTDSRQGTASAGYGPDFRFVDRDALPASDYDFENVNYALFAENVFFITDRLTVTPGVRLEYIDTRAEGFYTRTIRDQVGNILESNRNDETRNRDRMFALAGIGVSYKTASGLEWYGNASQNYRAINFSDIRIQNPTLRIDPQIGDERGYNVDLGIRTGSDRWAFDAGVYYLAYQNRIGAVQKRDPKTFQFYRLRANIADSRAYGVEGYFEWQALQSDSADFQVTLFVNGSYTEARYFHAEDKAIDGNRVELTPRYTLRTGARAEWGNFAATWLLSRVAEQYTEATNAEATPGGINGLIPAYTVMDLSVAYRWKRWQLEGSINNLTDVDYFTRRAAGYPGPGIIPSDGRTMYLTVGAKF